MACNCDQRSPCDCTQPLRVVITGASGNVASSLMYMVAEGLVFGIDQRIILHLMDLPEKMDELMGVGMELDDCAFPLLLEQVLTDDYAEGFRDVKVAFLVGAKPRTDGMERKDLLAANVPIFKEQGQALDKYANKNVRVLVVGNPSNTNCLVCSLNAPSIPRENFTALTRLDQNRAQSMVAHKLNFPVESINNIIIWGNHSNTQYPDTTYATYTNDKVTNLLSGNVDEEFLRGELIGRLQYRGTEVMVARKRPSALAGSKAAADHMRDWWFGTPPGRFVNMAVISDGKSYCIPEGICFSFPVQIKKRKWTIVPGLKIDDFSRDRLLATTEELLQEKAKALDLCNDAAARTKETKPVEDQNAMNEDLEN